MLIVDGLLVFIDRIGSVVTHLLSERYESAQPSGINGAQFHRSDPDIHASGFKESKKAKLLRRKRYF